MYDEENCIYFADERNCYHTEHKECCGICKNKIELLEGQKLHIQTEYILKRNKGKLIKENIATQMNRIVSKK